MKRRKVDLVVISDVHLGTYGAKAEELLRYLRSIKPKRLILNGDIVDIWQLSKSYFPTSHWKVVKEILSLVGKGTTAYYITGNHDELLRRIADTQFGNIHILNKLVLDLDGKKAWFFHGDVLDVSMQHAKWLAKLGAKGYGLLIMLNKLVNMVSEACGKGKISLSKKIKQKVSDRLKAKANFENSIADLAIDKNYTYVSCGHIHQPCIKSLANERGSVLYLNSGDWVESLTALEYHKGNWKLYEYYKDEHIQVAQDTSLTDELPIMLDGVRREVVAS